MLSQCLCKEGRFRDTHDICDLVIHIGGRYHYINLLVDEYCLIGKMDKALGALDDMESVGVEPNIVTYGTLVNTGEAMRT
jgi:pentatricopeptide repeat protein